MSATDLIGKVAIVTGSGRGLGLAYAKALAASGAALVVNDVTEEAAHAAADEITAAGGRAVAVAVAVGDAEAADRLVDTAVREFGRLDILVTNAGVLRDGVLWKMTDEAFDAVIRTHLRGTFTTGRAAAIRMREQGEGGRIILIGSPAGQFGNFGQTNYAAAKAGIVAMARTWSLELARAGITVNAVIPTALTAMTATIPMYKDIAEAFDRGAPLPREVRREHALGSPDDVSPLVVWLAGEAAGDVTGQAIGIGGDRLTVYAHPSEASVSYSDGGWTVEGIEAAWHGGLAEHEQPSGITLPPLSAARS